MDFSSLVSGISTVGFPIVCCICMGYFFMRINENYRADIKELQASQKEETKALVDAVNNNTMVIQKLVDNFSREEK